MMTQLITIPKFAEATGLPYRLRLHLVGTHQIPSVPVGCGRRIDVRWVDQGMTGGYCPPAQDSSTRHREIVRSSRGSQPGSAGR
jgi:hypothetical protein